MISILATPSGMQFSSSVRDLRFKITETQASVTINVDGADIYRETLTPVDGSITVSDLTGLLAIYAERRLTVDVKIIIVEQKVTYTTFTLLGQTYTIPDAPQYVDGAIEEFQVLFSRADVGVDASDFYNKHFLSILLGAKVTAMGRLEYLHFYGSEAASCLAYYADGTTQTFTPQVTGGNSRYTQLDVSPDNFAITGKVLTSYIVTAGDRSQQYDIDLEQPDCAPILLFDNSFGVQELLYCTGTHKVSPEYKRQSARIGGLLRNYDIEETRTFMADTGILTTAMANWADELFRSREIFLVNVYNGVPQVGKEIVITDSKSEFTNDDAEMPRFTFTYQYAQRIHNVVDLNREGRIFDNTFDNTFN
ncbi:MAG: hypothetical protein IJ253_12685 [Bacteroidaceae bacterium]|nr:hypothetical protein [Bacteroidaceae bacterium]